MKIPLGHIRPFTLFLCLCTLLFLLLLLSQPQQQAEATNPNPPYLPVVPNVENAFASLQPNGHWRVADTNGFLMGHFERNEDPPWVAIGSEHLQGIQRINEDFIVVSASAKDTTSEHHVNSNVSTLFIMQKTAEPAYKIVKILYPASVTGHNNQDPSNNTYWHGGGMALYGNYLAIPLESDEESKIVFYDVSNINQLLDNPTVLVPEKVSSEVFRPKTLNSGQNNKAGFVFLTQLPNDHYLLGVWTDPINPLDLLPPDAPGQLELYLSDTADSLDFDSNSFTTICENADNTSSTFCNNPQANQLPFEVPHYQTMNLVWDANDKLYAIATYNNGLLSHGENEDWAHLYEVTYDINSLENFTMERIDEKHMTCDSHSPLTMDYCNFQAAASTYVDETGALKIVSVPHYIDSYINSRSRLLRMTEFPPAVTRANLCNTFNGTSTPTNLYTIPGFHVNPPQAENCDQLADQLIVVQAAYRTGSNPSSQKIANVTYNNQDMQFGCRQFRQEYAAELWYIEPTTNFGDIDIQWNSLADDVVLNVVAVGDLDKHSTGMPDGVIDIQCSSGTSNEPSVAIEAEYNDVVLALAMTYIDGGPGANDRDRNNLRFNAGGHAEIVNTGWPNKVHRVAATGIAATNIEAENWEPGWASWESWPWAVAAISLRTHNCSYGPYPVPGKIETDHFRCGGEGVAFAENSAGNGHVELDRPDEVSSNGPEHQLTHDDYGFNLGWTRNGEWVAYDIDVQQTAVYNIIVRAAAPGNSARFHLALDGVDITGIHAVPQTNSWQNFSDYVIPNITLSAGRHVLSLHIDNQGANYNHLRFVNPTQTCQYDNNNVFPGRIEMEDFTCGGTPFAFFDNYEGNGSGLYRTDVGTEGPDIQQSGSSPSNGHHLAWTRVGEWVQYRFIAETAGTYQFTIRAASSNSSGTFYLNLDGIPRQAVSVSATGGWTTWQHFTFPETYYLSAGEHTFTFFPNANSINYDYIEAVLVGP